MKRALLLLLFCMPLAAQVGGGLSPDQDRAINTTMNSLGQIQVMISQVTNHTTPLILGLGWTLLAILGFHSLFVALRRSTQAMLQHYHANYFHLIAVLVVLVRFTIAALMLTFYTTPISGLGYPFPQLLPRFAQALSGQIDIESVRTVMGAINAVLHMPAPSPWNFLAVTGYLQVLGLMCLMQLGMILIDAISWIFVGLLTFIGPIFIAFFVDFRREKMFWDWFGDMAVYSMYQVFASVLIAVFGGLFVTLFSNTLHGVYTAGALFAQVPYLFVITVTFLFAMFMIPNFTARRFGQFGVIGQEWSNSLQRAVIGAFL